MNNLHRQHARALMDLLLKYEPLVNYPLHDVRTSLDAATFALNEAQMKMRLKNGKHLMMDCSAFITCIYKWIGLEDPNGLKYKYEGYTGTLLRNLPHYSDASKARVAAIAIFGPGTGEHGALVYKSGKDPMLCSHGWDGGPVLVPLSVERRFHRPPVTFLNVSGLKEL